MISLFFFLSMAEARVEPTPKNQNFKMIYDYKYKNLEDPTLGKRMVFSNDYHRDLRSCFLAAKKTYKELKQAETEGFQLIYVTLACQDLKTNQDYLYL